MKPRKPTREHKRRCRMRIAFQSPVGVECQHGYDACPICDPCTCDGTKPPRFGPPKRVQLRRTRGWRMPPNTKKVARPTQYGNKYRLSVDATDVDRRAAVECYRADLARMKERDPDAYRAFLRPLRGFNLACFCGLRQACHADVLLELANGK